MKSVMKTLLLLAALCLFPLAGFSAFSWETGSYTPADWQPVPGNFFSGVTPVFTGTQYTETGFTPGAVTCLTDGLVGGTKPLTEGQIFAIRKDATLEWTLASPINLKSLRIFTRWNGGGRDGIGIAKVEVRPIGQSGYVDIGAPAVSYGLGNNGTSGALYAILSDDSGAALAEKVIDVRLTFGNQDNNGTGYVEFEATGEAPPDWLVVSGSPMQLGTPDPNYGILDNLVRGETYSFSCPATTTDAYGIAEYACVGWTLTRANGTAETNHTTSASVTLTAENVGATLTWLWTQSRYLKSTDIRVVPGGAGTGYGTDWGNACGTIAEAVRLAAENPLGGEIWLAKGKHDITTTIALGTNTVLIGGFDGTETSASEADPEKNLTLLTPTSALNRKWWTNGEEGEMIWTQEDGQWVYHPPTTYSVVYGGTERTAFTDAEGGSPNCRIEGLVFTEFGVREVISFSRAASDGLVIRKCRFLANNGTGNTSASTVKTVGPSVTVADCLFEGCTRELYMDGVAKDVLVTNCTFSCGRCMWYGTSFGGLGLYGSLNATVQDCTFIRCQNDDGLTNINSGYGSTVYVAGDVKATFEDCVFEHCRTYGLVRGMFVSSSTQLLTLNRCRFLNNYADYSAGVNSIGSAGLSVQANTPTYIRDTCFVGNYLTTPNGGTMASCVNLSGGTRHTFLNCTFERNTAVASVKIDRLSTISGGTPTGVTLVHCLFNENTCYYSTDGGATCVRTADCSVFANPYGGNSATAFNTVAYNTAPDYKLNYCATHAGRYGLANVDFYNYTYEYKSGNDLGFRYQPLLSCDPVLDDALRTNGTVIARGVAPDSPVRKQGRPIWQATDGELYFYDTTASLASTPWRRCNMVETKLTDEQAAAIGLTLAAAPVSDAFGQPRRQGWIALGPLNAKPRGLMLLVR